MMNKIVFFMLLAFIHTACSSVPLQGRRHYNLEVENIGQQPHHNVKIKNVDENYIIPGLSRKILRPGIGGTFLKIPFRVPEWVEVQWESGEGVKFNKKVQIRSRLPDDFQGTIVLSIEEKTVLLSWKYEDNKLRETGKKGGNLYQN